MGSVIGAVLQGSQDLILSFHSLTHTPWYLTIPLVAISVNLLFRLPFNVYAHRVQQRRARLAPVLQAWNARIQRDVDRERVPAQRRGAEAETRFSATTARVWRHFRLQDRKLYANVLGLPFWLIGIDAIRRLCGGPTGILGRWALDSGDASPAAAETAAKTEAASAGDVAETATTSCPDTSGIPAGSLPMADPSSGGGGVAEALANAAAEPSLITGGILWFPDLTAPDPWHVLPLALSAILVLNLWPKSAAARRYVFNLDTAGGSGSSAPFSASSAAASGPSPAVLTRGARGRLVLHRGLFVVSLVIGPATMSLPAALHLYWITSSVASWATAKALTRLYPVGGKFVEPCKGINLPVIRPRKAEAQVGGRVGQGNRTRKKIDKR